MRKACCGWKARRLTTLAFAVVLVATGLSGQGQATTSPTLSEVKVFEGGGEPKISVNPLDPQNLVVNSGSMEGPSWTYRTTDGGSTWSSTSTPMWNVDQDIVFSATGDAFANHQKWSEQHGFYAVQVRKSTDGGETFDWPPVVVMERGATEVTFPEEPGEPPRIEVPCPYGIGHPEVFSQPKITAYRGSNSSINVLYLKSAVMFDLVSNEPGCETQREVVVRSVDGGMTWDSARVLQDQGGGFASSISVGPDEAFYFPARTADNNHGGGCIRVFKSVDRGSSYQSSTACGSPLGGSGFDDPTPVELAVAADPVDPSRVYVAFKIQALTCLAGQCTTPVINRQIWLTRSSDGGATWHAPVRVDSPLPDPTQEQLVIRDAVVISVSTNGRVDIAWRDHRNSLADNNRADFYYSYSTDHGASFAPDLRLTPVTATIGTSWNPGGNFYFGIASWGNKAYVTYGQDRDGDAPLDVYVNTVTF